MASLHQIFQLRPLARKQEVSRRVVEAGLIEPANGRAQFGKLPAQLFYS
jgi:hypothetical protein